MAILKKLRDKKRKNNNTVKKVKTKMADGSVTKTKYRKDGTLRKTVTRKSGKREKVGNMKLSRRSVNKYDKKGDLRKFKY